MSENVIQVEKLGKRFHIGKLKAGSTLRDVLTNAVKVPFRRRGHDADTILWALRGVSFEVRQGEVVGLIGRNGAGKSTLLKILARVIRPTTGWAEIRGRVGSLLEVGTGFHHELSGRENIFLSGAMLGMKKAEIRKKFDEIVAFSEVGKFLDTPLKHYSSGMQMRLAFAVAAHLEPEILLVDEVLAVGDASFQKKCMGKMKDVARHGRTILFVSHNVSAIARMCSRCILMDHGRATADGPMHDVLGRYMREGTETTASREWSEPEAPGSETVRLRAVRARSNAGAVVEAFDIRQPIGIEMVFDVLRSGKVLAPNIHVFNQEGVNVFISIDSDPTWARRPRPPGRYTSTAWIPGNFLAEGTFLVGAAASTFAPMTIHFYEREAVAFQVIDTIDGDSVRGEYAGTLPGVVRPMLEWTTCYEPSSFRSDDVSPAASTLLL